MRARALVIADGDSCRSPEAGDQRDRQSARAKAAFLPAAEGDRMQRWPLVPASASDQCADAFRGVDLVAGDADQVDPPMPEEVEVFAEGLSGVYVQVGIVR